MRISTTWCRGCPKLFDTTFRMEFWMRLVVVMQRCTTRMPPRLSCSSRNWSFALGQRFVPNPACFTDIHPSKKGWGQLMPLGAVAIRSICFNLPPDRGTLKSELVISRSLLTLTICQMQSKKWLRSTFALVIAESLCDWLSLAKERTAPNSRLARRLLAPW